MKYIKNEMPGMPLSQSEISDELAEKWKVNGPDVISDTPWPDLPLVRSFVVVDDPQ